MRLRIVKLFAKLVLPDRIELSTSPLPRECSTTELRQHAGRQANRIGRKRRHRRPVLATRPPQAQARETLDIDAIPESPTPRDPNTRARMPEVPFPFATVATS